MSSYHYRPRKIEDDNQSEASSQKVIKRKVLRLEIFILKKIINKTFSLRHYNGKATVCDESRSGLIIYIFLFHLLFFFFCYLETGSVLDSHDASYLNDLHYQRHRRRIESASDIDDQSIFSDDVIKIYMILFFFFFF